MNRGLGKVRYKTTMHPLALVSAYDVSLSYTVARVCKQLNNQLQHIDYGYLVNCRLPLQLIKAGKRINSLKYNYIHASHKHHALLIALYGMLSCKKSTLLVNTSGANPFADYLPDLPVTSWINLKNYGAHYYERVIIMYCNPYNCLGNQQALEGLRHSNVWYFNESSKLPLLFASLIPSSCITRLIPEAIRPNISVQLLDIDSILGIHQYISTAEFCRLYTEICHHYVDSYIYRFNQLLLLAAERLLITEPTKHVSLYHQGSGRCLHSPCADCMNAIEELSRYTISPYSYNIILAAEVTPKILDMITYQCHYKDINIAILYSKNLQGESYKSKVLDMLIPYKPTLH